jgi:hypothetical protein
VYRPNFCADCGERVLRERWRAWTSRRFCPACEKRFGREWARPLVACCLIAGAAFAAGRMMRPAPPPLTIERRELPVPALLAQQSRVSDGAAQQGSPSQPAPESQTPAQHGPDGTALERPTDPFEVVSLCGARTKKGTPCSRRVRGTGRCWQHRGLPAMLPASKLIVRD